SFEISFEEFKVRYTIQPKAESWQIELIVQEGFGRKILQKEFETFSKAFEEVVDDMARIKQQFLGKQRTKRRSDVMDVAYRLRDVISELETANIMAFCEDNNRATLIIRQKGVTKFIQLAVENDIAKYIVDFRAYRHIVPVIKIEFDFTKEEW
ncbi:MAG: hypothetical protein ACK4R7_06155, partial [Fervidobacterium sp.]